MPKDQKEEALVEKILENTLQKMTLIDQVGFPYLKEESGNSSITEGKSFVHKGDYSDMKWLTYALNHGYSISWEDVGNIWKTQYITVGKDFAELLSVCPVSYYNNLNIIGTWVLHCSRGSEKFGHPD